jgi:phosphoribosyl-ATP pyrophosphohydrolase/phosphoribosyl-AMP cyclohydrolase
MTPVEAELKWDDSGLIPAVVQEAETGEVLMVAWMDRDALRATLDTGTTHFWSRSRQAPWPKGETSGHVQHVQGVYADCDRDTLLVEVHQEGVACHTGARTCFFTRLGPGGGEIAPTAPGPAIVDAVERVIQSRKVEPREGSYVSRLLARGDPGVLKKIGEESTEVVVAALAENESRLISEMADLGFHTLVLLGSRGISIHEVFAELARRHQPPPEGG